MSQQDRDHIEKLIRINRRRLNVLEEQAKTFGLHAPPHVLTEIEDLKEQIGELEAQLVKQDAPVVSQGKLPSEIRPLTLQERQRLVELLLAAPSMADRSIRDSLLLQLPSSIQHAISRNSNNRVDVFNIVNTVLNHKGGLQALIEALRFFESDSLSLQAINQFAATLQPE